MVFFPHCKINLGLNILTKRTDGFHEIETCFYPIPWTDILEIIPSEQLTFTSSGLPIPGRPEENLCLRAYQLLKKDFDLGPVKIHLHKIIPMGAGLGGGSSDAAFTLRLLNTIFELKISEEVLKQYASHLGSDCSFFLKDTPFVGTGRGEILSPVQISLKGKFMVIIIPPIHISTAEAYAGVKPAMSSRIFSIITKGNSSWRNLLKNDFEESVFRKHPQIKAIKEKLYQLNAIYASMSGSGSAVYGIFDQEIHWPAAEEEGTYWSGYLN
jgi:4-diphosphocytidyl-2-C-methyl-D-erythritol kinase